MSKGTSVNTNLNRQNSAKNLIWKIQEKQNTLQHVPRQIIAANKRIDKTQEDDSQLNTRIM
jgi:hypothetical protein